jgi:NAD(P)-dependent dehydrogenase (short-subunit alcohol dehydrogenase family)
MGQKCDGLRHRVTPSSHRRVTASDWQRSEFRGTQHRQARDVVTLSSGLHFFGRIAFDDLQGERRFGANRAYAQSKLANLMFAAELQRRSDRHNWSLLSAAAHPGATRTKSPVQRPEPWAVCGKTGFTFRLTTFPGMWKDVDDGALPTLYAATSPDAAPGESYGPDGLLEMTGQPTVARRSRRSRDTSDAARLWDISENLTGVHYAAYRAAA